MKYIFFVMLMLALVGCSSTKVIHTSEVEYKYVTIELPSNLVTKCKPPSPPSKELYLKSSNVEREKLLTEYVITLLGEVKKCDNKITGIKTYVSKHNNLYMK